MEGELFTSSDSLAAPFRIVTDENYLYVGDAEMVRPLIVFDRNTGEFVKWIGSKGSGPRELAGVWSIDFKPGSDRGWVYEGGSSYIMKQFGMEGLTGKSVRLQGTGFPLSPVRISGDSIASTGFLENGRMAIYSPDGVFTRFIGTHPPGESKVPIPVRQHAYQAKAQTNSEGSLIVLASRNTDLIEIFNATGLLHAIRGPGFDEPVYTLHGDKEGNQWLSIDPETVRSYTSLAVTDDLIFTLYSGMTEEEIRRRSGTFTFTPAGTVFVFSWSGTPLAALKIKHDALSIAVSWDGKDMYAIYWNPVPMIMRYNLPRLG